ncbi:MAG: hypothetical protein HOQ35_04770 [Acidobacteriaceae bacterium]|nr:hypothetical protein [Acidobacteriaceae bacterium]
MNHLLYTVIPLAMIGMVFLIWRNDKFHREQKAPRPPNPRQLSVQGCELLEIVGEMPRPPRAPIDPCNPLPMRDCVVVFLNSRDFVTRANHTFVTKPHNSDAEELYRRATQNHDEIKTLVLHSVTEAVVGKLRTNPNPLYASVLMWKYAEEIELLTQVAEILGDEALERDLACL